jgi:hypothetical protein
MNSKFKSPKKCIFCDGPKPSRTHIWPDWLKRLLDPDGTGHVIINATNNTHETKQGSIYSQKPYLACVGCNTGWMHKFEDEMLKFAVPIFTGERPVTLSEYQIRVFAVWVSLIAVLAQYCVKKDRSYVTITPDDRTFLKRHRMPPAHWSIFAISQDTHLATADGGWRTKYGLHTAALSQVQPWRGEWEPKRSKNTQVASFGMGKVFVQTFVCPIPGLVRDYRIAAKAKGMKPIWPMPSGFWPFTKGTAKFPTKFVLDDESAQAMHSSFPSRLSTMYGAGIGLSPPVYG